MKVALQILLCFFCIQFGSAQLLELDGAVISPAPLNTVENSGVGTASFEITESTFVNVAPGTLNLETIELTMSNIALIDGEMSISGHTPYYSVSISGDVITFTQIATIPGFSFFTISMDVMVTANTPISGADNGFIAIIGEGSAIESSTSTYTYTEATTPVELIFFTAERKGKTAVLSWETATEINNEYFDIERSVDGIVFEAIGRMDGNGTTAEKHNYIFTDDVPKSGLNYYRLNQVDYDGKRDYTPIRSVKFGDIREGVKLEMNYSPNPVSDQLSIISNGDLEKHTVRILDMTGKLMVRYDYIAGMIVPMNSYGEGVYLIQIVDADGYLKSTERIVKYNR